MPAHLIDPQPVITREQAARDAAWTRSAIASGRLRRVSLRSRRIEAGEREKMKAEAARLFAEGLTDIEISRRVGISRQQLCVWLGPKRRRRKIAKEQSDA